MRGSTPIAAWREEDAAGDRQVVVALFDGIAWVPLGGGASTLPRTDASAHALAIDGWTLPVVAWVEDGAVRVARLNR